MRMHIEQRPIIFQISMLCSTVATAFNLASPMEIVENKRGFAARYRDQWRERWRATDFGIQSAVPQHSLTIGAGRLFAWSTLEML